MSAADFLSELMYPLKSGSIMLVMILQAILVAFVGLIVFVNPYMGLALAGLLALGLGPGLSRYLVSITERRAHGYEAEPPTAEMFSVTGGLWGLLPVAIALAMWGGAIWMRHHFGDNAAWVFLAAAGATLPAVFSTLAITHSILQSLNPVLWVQLIHRIGPGYNLAALLGVATVLLPSQIIADAPLIGFLLAIYLPYALFAVAGAMTTRHQLVEDVDIPAPLDPAPEKVSANLEKERTGVLNIAYGFASRGNREGAFKHVQEWLTRDPDPYAGWSWFFERMTRWEQPEHALFFGQRYLHHLLEQGDALTAVKLIQRCRLENENWKPLGEDRERAIEAARVCGHSELESVLRRL